MSSAAAIDFTYRYPFASNLDRGGGPPRLRLATCTAAQEHPYFFDGALREPKVAADMLLALADVVGTHFFMPRPAILDPVATSSEEVLRFEGFSGCCGVYARADLPAEALRADLLGRGTTNVDFNPPMRAALTRVRRDETVRLAIGRDRLELERAGETTVEKKVKLPLRWVKGFSEVQAYQPALERRFEVPAAGALRFVRALPGATTSRRPAFVVAAGRSLRVSRRPSAAAVRLSGPHRLRVLEPLLAGARALHVWWDDSAGTSAWEVRYDAGRFFLMVSPDLYRGFSGEGQVLAALAEDDWRRVLPEVRAALNWQARIDAGDLSRRLGVSRRQVTGALAALGARGLAGYDVTTGAFFHRELPFDLSRVEQLQPRLKGARKLLASGGVELVKRDGDRAELTVAGTGTRHYVRLAGDDEPAASDRCTCPWFSRHQGQRGPCKHVLASRLWLESESGADGTAP